MIAMGCEQHPCALEPNILDVAESLAFVPSARTFRFGHVVLGKWFRIECGRVFVCGYHSLSKEPILVRQQVRGHALKKATPDRATAF